MPLTQEEQDRLRFLELKRKRAIAINSSQEPSLSDLESNIGKTFEAFQQELGQRKQYEQEQAQKPSVDESLFPSLSQDVKENKALPWQLLSGLSDITSIPTRGLATLRGQEFSDPNANILRPEIEKAKKATPNWANLPIEMLGGMAGDPTTALGLAPINKAINISSKVGSSINKTAGKVAENLSGVPQEALRAYGKDGATKALIKAEAGNKDLLAEEILTKLDDVAKSNTEQGIVREALQNMPEMNFNNVVNTLENVKYKNPRTEQAIAINNKIDNQIKLFKETPNVSAQDYYDIRKQVDDFITGFGKDYGDVSSINKKFMQVRKTMKDDLLNNAPDMYKDAIDTWHKNIEKAEELKSLLGKTDKARDKKIESFITNLTNKNKTYAQKTLENIDPNLLERAQASSYAEKLGLTGPGTSPSLLSQHTTGKSLAGLQALAPLLLNAGNFNPLYAMGALPVSTLSSPRLASKVLGTMDKAGAAVNKINPKAIKNIQKSLLALSLTQNTTNPIFNTFKSNSERR